MDRARRSANVRPLAALGAASPCADTSTLPPARRCARLRRDAAASSFRVAEPRGKVTTTDGAGRGAAGPNAPAGNPPNRGTAGAAPGNSGNGPLSGRAGTTPAGAATATATGAGTGATGALGAGARAGAAVAASNTATEASGSGAGRAAATGAAALTTGAVPIGSRSPSRRVPSRSAVSRACNARLVAASGSTGRAGTSARFGYGSATPGGGGRTAAMRPPCSPCHHSTGVSGVSLLS